MCYWTSVWCFFFQQLQIRLQGREKELETLTVQIVAEKVILFFWFSLSSLLSNSVKPQAVQKMRLFADGYFDIRWLAGFKTRQIPTPTSLWVPYSANKTPIIKMDRENALCLGTELPFCFRSCWFPMANSNLFLSLGSKGGMQWKRSDMKDILP